MAETKPKGQQIVAANHLLTGQVVYLTAEGDWSTDPAGAQFAETKEDAAALLERGRAGEAGNRIVGPELIAAERRDGKPWPTRNREVIRALGPTVREDLGYQAEGRDLWSGAA